jgi:hypothetical protein
MLQQKTERPTSVTTIALLQFGKAWVLLTVAVVAWVVPDAMRVYGSDFSAVVYFAAHGKNPHGFLLPLVAGYVTVMGWGLWSLKGWARSSLMVTSGLTVAIWVRRLLFDQAMGDTTLKTPLEVQVVGFLLLADAITFFYLFFGVGVKRAFGESE